MNVNKVLLSHESEDEMNYGSINTEIHHPEIDSTEGDYDDDEEYLIENNGYHARKLRRYRIAKTICMVFIWVCMGTYDMMITTSIDDLRQLIDVNYEQFSRSLMVKSFGMLAGSAVGGIMADSFPAKVDIFLGVSMLCMCFSPAVVPFCPNVLLMGVAFCLQGLGQTSVSAAGNAHCMHMWGKENSAPLMTLHFGYALGNLFGPLLVRPFLQDFKNETTATTIPHNLFDSEINFNVNKDFTVMSNSTQESHIWIPFVAAGTFGVVISLLFFVFFLIGLPIEYQAKTRERGQAHGQNLKKILSPGMCTGGNKAYGLQMFTLMFFFYVTNVGKDVSLLTFTLPIAISEDLPLNFTKQSADTLILAIAICAVIGRGLFTIFAKILPIQSLVFIEIFFILTSQIMLNIWGLKSVVVYWVGNCMYSLFNSPSFPSVLVWADKYVKMTAVAVALVDIATGVAVFAFTWLAGYVFQYKSNGAAWVLYLSLGCGVVMTMVMIAMQILGSFHGTRDHESENTED